MFLRLSDRAKSRIRIAIVSAGGVLIGVPCASAWNAQIRFVERVGMTETVLPGNTINVTDGLPRNIRVQIGVFDDAGGAAPSGGLNGWIDGTLTASGSHGNSDETRTPGRLSPFSSNQSSSANGAPEADPFGVLAGIDATRGTSSHSWGCDFAIPSAPLPIPVATVLGRNTFVSVYEFTIDPGFGASSYTVTAGGAAEAGVWVLTTNFPPPICPLGGGAAIYTMSAIETRTIAGVLTVQTAVCPSVTIISSPQPVKTCPGGVAQFSASATGFGTVSYQWRKDGVPLGNVTGYISGADSPTLSIGALYSNHGAFVDCVVSDSAACLPRITGSARLTVCPADANCSGTVSVQDIFDFLTDWFGGC